MAQAMMRMPTQTQMQMPMPMQMQMQMPMQMPTQMPTQMPMQIRMIQANRMQMQMPMPMQTLTLTLTPTQIPICAPSEDRVGAVQEGRRRTAPTHTRDAYPQSMLLLAPHLPMGLIHFTQVHSVE
jgi:hypothetical protein